MQELITKITEKAGISSAQAQTAIYAIKDFIKEKFPMLAGAVDNFLPDATEADSVNKGNANSGGNGMDKISDFIPGFMGEAAEDFTKQQTGGLLGGDVK